MAEFNFNVKRQSYEIALEETKDALTAGDGEAGNYYLDRAIALCGQLLSHCTVRQMAERYQLEQRKLLSLQSALKRGENPFLPRAGGFVAPPPASGEPAPSRKEQPAAAPQQGEKGGFFNREVPTTTLRDVAGLEEVKRQIRLRVLAPMKDPELSRKYMDEAGCRILLYGPPGCGKSFVAEAIAGELKCACAVINSSDLLDKYVGEGAKKLVELFREADEHKNCLIFFDELEALFSSREEEDSRYTKDILTTFLTCLSGFGKREEGVKVIVGATNRPWALDTALLRGKRFDTHIYVGLPDADARAFLVRRAFQKNPKLIEDSDTDVETLVSLFEGYSCADISSLLGKMKIRAFERTLKNREEGNGREEPVTAADAREVLSGFRNSVTQESLEAYCAFQKGEI